MEQITNRIPSLRRVLVDGLVLWRHEGLAGYLARGAVGGFLLKLTNTSLQFGTVLVLAGALGPEDYGVYAFVFSLVLLLSIPARLGTPTLLVRLTATYQAGGQWALMRGLWIRSTQLVVGLSAVIVALAIGGALLTTSPSWQARYLTTALAALFLIPLMSLAELRGAALRGLRKVVIGQLPDYLLRPGLFLLLIVVVLLLPGPVAMTPATAMALHAAAAGAAFVAGIYLLVRSRPKELSDHRSEYATSEWLQSIVPLSVLSGMQVVNSQAGVVVLGLLTSPAEVGLFRVAVQGAALVAFSLSVINMVIGPQIARLHSNGDKARLQRMVTWSARAILFAALPVAGLFIAFGDALLIRVLGTEYAPAYPALVILCAGQMANAAMGSVGFILNMTGHERDAMWGTIFAAALNTGLCFFLIPVAGLVGAALASAISLSVWNILLAIRVYQRTGLGTTAFFMNPSGKPS